MKKFGSEKSSVVKNVGSEKFGGEKFSSQIHHTKNYEYWGANTWASFKQLSEKAVNTIVVFFATYKQESLLISPLMDPLKNWKNPRSIIISINLAYMLCILSLINL